MTSVKIKYTKNAFIKLRCNLVNRSVAKSLFYENKPVVIYPQISPNIPPPIISER